MKSYTLAFLILLLLAGPATAGEDDAPPDTERPKIGLALGGGAARGAAHVGVIRELERLGIPVDYVAGTSMGSVVGALYSLGYSADQIEKQLLEIDWADVFSDRIERRNRSLRRKEDDTATFFPLEFGIKDGQIAPPAGFIAGQKFAFAFNAPGLITQGHDSFDDLPIPFRAVATDLEMGEKVVLDHGNLIRCVRASMSIPGVFPPVEYEGMLLVDGYLVSNVPVDAVRAMGADIVIAVDVGRRPEDMTREQLETLGGITEQASRIVSAESVRAELERADIVVKPLVTEWTGSEFDRMAEIIPLGAAAAAEVESQLANLAVPPEDYKDWRHKVQEHPQPYPRVDLIVLDNRTRIDNRVIDRLITVPKDAPLDLDALLLNLDAIYELGLVASTDFDLTRVDGYSILTIIVREKHYSPFIIHVGGAYTMGYDGNSNILLRARINKREINRYGAEWRTDLSIGQVTGIETEFYQPLGFGRAWFLRTSAIGAYRRDSFYLDGFNLASYRHTQLGWGLFGGLNVKRTTRLQAGFDVVRASTKPSSGIPLPEVAETSSGPGAQILTDVLDDPRIPNEGFFLKLDWRGPRGWFDSDRKFDRLWGNMTLAHTFGHTTLLGFFQGGSDLDSGMPYYDAFFLGGMRSLSGYKRDRLRGSTFGVGSLGVMQRLGGGTLPFASRYYLGFWFDVGNTWASTVDASFRNLRYNGAVSFIMDTPLGPLEIGYGKAEQGEHAFHLQFGIHISSPVN